MAGLHFLNTPLIFWTIYQVMTRFLKDKLRKRIHFNENANSLHQHIDPKILPRSVGGHLDEDEAFDRTLAPRILKRNIPYEGLSNLICNLVLIVLALAKHVIYLRKSFDKEIHLPLSITLLLAEYSRIFGTFACCLFANECSIFTAFPSLAKDTHMY